MSLEYCTQCFAGLVRRKTLQTSHKGKILDGKTNVGSTAVTRIFFLQLIKTTTT